MAKKRVWLLKKGTTVFYVDGFKIRKSKVREGLTTEDAETYHKVVGFGPINDIRKQFWGTLDKDVFTTLEAANTALRTKLTKTITAAEKRLAMLQDLDSKPAELVDDYAKK